MQEVFSYRLATARKKKGLRQSDLAVLVGVCPASISNWETGARNLGSTQMLGLLCVALGVTPGYLIGFNTDDGETDFDVIHHYRSMLGSR